MEHGLPAVRACGQRYLIISSVITIAAVVTEPVVVSTRNSLRPVSLRGVPHYVSRITASGLARNFTGGVK